MLGRGQGEMRWKNHAGNRKAAPSHPHLFLHIRVACRDPSGCSHGEVSITINHREIMTRFREERNTAQRTKDRAFM
ncbi:unnamed protein product [Pleuronectes platessa]|uniref:Uncharacterized protein n=1 Tax=Pleuronectes platessa TaxID=8262 RepID=A0A9N7VML6_PLEPL|nr:unnamed protein product [Pleuronectes platessa]